MWGKTIRKFIEIHYARRKVPILPGNTVRRVMISIEKSINEKLDSAHIKRFAE